MSNDIVLQCDDISKIYVDGDNRVEVLKNLNFTAKKGERIAIVGASGSGKTTLLQILGGLDAPTSGTFQVNGQDINAMSERQKAKFRNQNLGFIYQFHHLLPEFNALENVTMPLLIRGLSVKQANAKAMTIIERVGLNHRVDHRIGELSGGERQRIAIARALVTDPSCVLADEPTGNLDQDTADQVFNLMNELNEELQTTFIMVTHNQQLAAAHDRVLVLSKGQLQANT